MMNETQRLIFEQLARPLMQFLNDHTNPHHSIIITTTTAEVVSGECAFTTMDYVKD